MKIDSKYIELAKICKATYSGPIRHTVYKYAGVEFEKQKIIHGSFQRGYCRLFWHHNNLTIAFRGTRESVDWSVSNFKAFPVPLRDSSYSNTVYVHRGFQNTLDFFDKTTKKRSLEAIFYHLEKNNLLEKNIVITGHSLGGALATLFAVKLRGKYPLVVTKRLSNIITFGAPSVGGKSFHNFYGDLHSKTIRIVNGADIVPFTPPIWYHHVGNEIWLGKDKAINNIGWLKRLFYSLNILELTNLSNDHSIDAYIERLKE